MALLSIIRMHAILLTACFHPVVLMPQVRSAAAQGLGTTGQSATDTRATAVSEGEAGAVERANKWTVGIVGGTVDGPNMRFATELQTALDDGDNLRVLATVSRGTRHNVLDLLYLKGVDVGFVNTAIFDDFKKEGKVKNIENRIQYISQIQVSAYQMLVSPDIKTVQDLQGKKIVTPKGAWASPLTVDILKKNKVTAEFLPDSINVGIEKLQKGEVSGVAYAFAKGDDNIYTPVAAKNSFHVLQIGYDKFADSYYIPVSLEHDDYPNLIGPGETIDTLGAVVVLAVYNWPKDSDRFRKVERFIRYYFERFDTLKKPPFHPQWKAINLAATVPGWKRYWFAEEMLKKYNSEHLAAAVAKSDEEKVLEKLRSIGASGERKLIDEFLEWKRREGR